MCDILYTFKAFKTSGNVKNYIAVCQNFSCLTSVMTTSPGSRLVESNR